MKMKTLLLITCLFMLSGCFETDFHFRTVVKPDGSVRREAKIQGRGANRFLPPAGSGWQVKTYETRGGQSILEDKYYHIEASGNFKNAAKISSDYQYNIDRNFDEISDEERSNFIKLGIVEPFEDNVYSKNNISIVKHRGLLKSVFEYREVFENKGIIELLLNDLRKEVIRNEQNVTASKTELEPAPLPEAEPAEPAGVAEEPVVSDQPLPEKPEVAVPTEPVPSVTIEGQLLAPKKVEELAKDKLLKDIFPRFKFHSEVTLPGKIVSSNAGRVDGNTSVWEFGYSDFSGSYERYELNVKSEMIEWKTIVLFGALVFLILIGIGSITSKKPAPKAPSRRR